MNIHKGMNPADSDLMELEVADAGFGVTVYPSIVRGVILWNAYVWRMPSRNDVMVSVMHAESRVEAIKDVTTELELFLNRLHAVERLIKRSGTLTVQAEQLPVASRK